jgi:RNA polymerase sigma factor (sigma-70 family)
MLYITKIETNELIRGLQNKSEEAFTVLYDDYSAALFGIAFKIVNNKTIAEDLLQDVFVKIWTHIDMYDADKGTLFTWMLNITRNTCKDYFRTKQYGYQSHISQADLEDIPIKNMPQATSYQEESWELQLLTQKLDPKYKEIIDLVYIYGYSQEQVAEKLTIPLGTVKTRSRDALKQLRHIYSL